MSKKKSGGHFGTRRKGNTNRATTAMIREAELTLLYSFLMKALHAADGDLMATVDKGHDILNLCQSLRGMAKLEDVNLIMQKGVRALNRLKELGIVVPVEQSTDGVEDSTETTEP